jgi:putative Holliday junction resolvase
VGAIISLDIGLKRIGVAISGDSKIVTPLPAIERRNRKQASRDISQVLSHWSCTTLLVGVPNGSNHDEMFRRFSHFVSLLDFSGEVIYFDEDFSSFEAKELMRGEIREKRDGRVDSLSAKIVLERFLEKR